MLQSILILVISLALLAYWLRHTCVLMLEMDDTEQERAEQMVSVNGLSCASVHRALSGGLQPDPEECYRSLDKDYRLLMYLLRHAPDLNTTSLHRWLLAADYRFMQILYKLSRHLHSASVERSLHEMSRVLLALSGSIEKVPTEA